MLVDTRYFGTIDLDEKKMITFEQGIMGFEDHKRWALLYDIEKEDDSAISWLQSLDDAGLALPVINPFCVMEQYNPTVEDELLKGLGEFKDEDLLVLLALTVPEDVEKITANMKAPFLINPDTARGIQVIVENQDYPVRFAVYEAVRRKKEEKGEA